MILRSQAVNEEVLQTILAEVEGILNSKPLGYVSSDVADPDPVTTNLLLTGQQDASLHLPVMETQSLPTSSGATSLVVTFLVFRPGKLDDKHCGNDHVPHGQWPIG